jgi:BirA family biotin operon repressor/biotin-[acetyl-CoA-carboxylase] ligase
MVRRDQAARIRGKFQGMHASQIDPFDPTTLVRAGLLAHVEHLAETTSTMDVARQLAADLDTRLPLLVIADRQSSGRGRRGAGWWQAPWSLAVSLVVDAHAFGEGTFPPATWSLACGVALAEAIRDCEPTVEAVVRWPNDVEVSARKLAGILVETVAGPGVIFGVGVNTTGTASDAPEAIRHRVATIPDVAGHSLARQKLLEAFLPRLVGLLADMAKDPRTLGERYRPLCCLTGRSVTIHIGDVRHTGTCQGIADDGRLMLDTPNGPMHFASGSLTPPEDVWPGGVHGD